MYEVRIDRNGMIIDVPAFDNCVINGQIYFYSDSDDFAIRLGSHLENDLVPVYLLQDGKAFEYADVDDVKEFNRLLEVIIC